jgi:frataxin
VTPSLDTINLRQPCRYFFWRRALLAAQHFSTCSLFASESAFDVVANQMLLHISDNLAKLEDEFDLELEYSQGVLSVEVLTQGKWLLNKQAPNQQIWWSSPVSGPLRFEYTSAGHWVSTRNASDRLVDMLRAEMADALGTDIAWTDGA